MVKGKAKGWRPPAADTPGNMLFGSADHLTGNTIASPVQLRQEGVAIPKDHLNYGDDWSKGGSWKNTNTTATGADAIPVAPKLASTVAPLLQPATKVKAQPPLLQPKPKIKVEPKLLTSALSSSSAAIAEEVKVRVTKEELNMEVQRMNTAKTEIERRREAMLQNEKTAQQSYGVPSDDAQSRRRAVEARRLEAETAAREAEANHRQTLAAISRPSSTSGAPVLQQADQQVKDEIEEEPEDGRAQKAYRKCEDEENEHAVKRQCTEPNIASQQTQAPLAANAMQQGLQHWAEKVNGLANGDTDLVTRCRDFVRKRILKAHATGNLHSVNWDEEPIPTVDSLLEVTES